MEIVLNESNFEAEVLRSDIPVLADFWAEWCGPCRMLAPIIEEIADEYDGKIKVGKINVDECPSLASKFGISSIPTVMLFENGNVKSTSIGYHDKEYFINLLK